MFKRHILIIAEPELVFVDYTATHYVRTIDIGIYINKLSRIINFNKSLAPFFPNSCSLIS